MTDDTDDPTGKETVEASPRAEVRVIDRSVADPHNVAPVFVDWCWHHNVHGGVARLTLVANQDSPKPDGSGGTEPDTVVVARLRFTVATAVELRDKLNQIILAATSSQDKKPN